MGIVVVAVYVVIYYFWMRQ